MTTAFRRVITQSASKFAPPNRHLLPGEGMDWGKGKKVPSEAQARVFSMKRGEKVGSYRQ